MFRKSQQLNDIVIAFPLIKKDGTQAVGLSLLSLNIKIISPTGAPITNFTSPFFFEPNDNGVYIAVFSAAAAVKVFTTVDNPNPYIVTLDSSETDVEPTSREVWITSMYPWESAKEESVVRTLGLLMENHVEDDIVRDSTTGLKTSSIIYLYATASDALVHDKSTGLIAKYNVSVSYDNRKMSRLTVTKQEIL